MRVEELEDIKNCNGCVKKPLLQKCGIVVVDLGLLLFELYVSTDDNGRKFIYIRSVDGYADIMDANDRCKQFRTTRNAEKYCLKITKKFCIGMLKEVVKYDIISR